ncbi:primase C-terminal domain-containing protein [Macrococcoides caseolyticum]|uniref:primase C-terminal domain-containing protein n=1 Tax=Macrococcoides caseolyticum TaxID=69966 RepID=UPI001C605973|nr:primase C-terminal domain-containing protein [Macrococcus caseolyticus]QYA35012.1 primase C-terminal domain-containing protein [Macrococcus caseolyticus]
MMLNVYKNQYSNSYIGSESVTFNKLIEWLKMTIISNDKFSNGTFLIGDMKEDKHRNDANVINRHALTIDIDDLSPGTTVINELKERFNFSYILYSTHNHEPHAPRYRLIIPLDKPITKKYYKPALQLFEKQLGLSFDEKAFDWSRCMARTSLKTKESEFIFDYQDTYFLDTGKLVAGLEVDETITVDYSSMKRDSSHWDAIGYGGLTDGDGRNNALASITGHLMRKNVDINLIIGLLTTWNDSNKPPLQLKEFERTVRSIITKELQRRQGGA